LLLMVCARILRSIVDSMEGVDEARGESQAMGAAPCRLAEERAATG
jgi:hypothetical protein